MEFLNDFPVTIPQEITFLQNQIVKYKNYWSQLTRVGKKKMKELSNTIGHLIYLFMAISYTY